ncbi:MAG: TM0996/MTH895 family glutaredoxin-like protein [Chloroflexi bacterium]|nr:TM0996/MTH895 family glutaredoxin-like protein [Chloroflexota bacterium]
MHVIEVLGHGCEKCRHVEKVVRESVDAMGIEAEIRHVTDDASIAASGILSTPGLVIDGRLVLAGRIPTREQLAGWLEGE